MRQILSNYLHHYYHLLLCTCLLTAVTYLYAGTTIDWKYAIWTGLVTFLLYNYHSVLTLSISSLIEFFRNNMPFLALIILSGIVGLILLPKGFLPIIFLIVALIICLFYFRQGILNLRAGRDYYLLKPLMIGLVFGILTALIPYLHSGYSVYEAIHLTTGRVAFIVVLAMIFDMGKVSEDKNSKGPTLHQKIGLLKTKIIAIFILVIAAVAEGYGAWTFLLEFPIFMSFVVTWFLAFLLILFAGPKKGDWYYLFLVDGLMSVPWVLTQI